MENPDEDVAVDVETNRPPLDKPTRKMLLELETAALPNKLPLDELAGVPPNEKKAADGMGSAANGTVASVDSESEDKTVYATFPSDFDFHFLLDNTTTLASVRYTTRESQDTYHHWLMGDGSPVLIAKQEKHVPNLNQSLLPVLGATTSISCVISEPNENEDEKLADENSELAESAAYSLKFKEEEVEAAPPKTDM